LVNHVLPHGMISIVCGTICKTAGWQSGWALNQRRFTMEEAKTPKFVALGPMVSVAERSPGNRFWEDRRDLRPARIDGRRKFDVEIGDAIGCYIFALSPSAVAESIPITLAKRAARRFSNVSFKRLTRSQNTENLGRMRVISKPRPRCSCCHSSRRRDAWPDWVQCEPDQ